MYKKRFRCFTNTFLAECVRLLEIISRRNISSKRNSSHDHPRGAMHRDEGGRDYFFRRKGRNPRVRASASPISAAWRVRGTDECNRPTNQPTNQPTDQPLRRLFSVSLTHSLPLHLTHSPQCPRLCALVCRA